MANRLTQMDGEVPLVLPDKVARERTTKEVASGSPVKAGPLRRRDFTPKHQAFWDKPATSTDRKPGIVERNKSSFAQLVRNKGKASYQEFMPLDQAGSAVIAHDNTKGGDFVAVKRVKRVDPKPVYTVPDFKSDHLVNIKDMFLEGNDEIIVIYEQMDVSLRHIMAVSGGPLQAFEIAAICKELVAGLSFIHEKLLLYHGAVGCDTILLHQNGKIKIANIAESILERKVYSAEKGVADIKRIGSIMIDLMEPATSILDPSSTVLKEPQKWRDELGIKDFLAATQHSSLAQLKSHLFLPPESQGSWLGRHVFSAVRAAKVPWDKPSLS